VTMITATPSMAYASMKELIEASVPCMLHGGTGISKSSLVNQLAKAIQYNLIDVRAVLLDPVDLRGLPHVENGWAVWAAPGFLPRVDRDGSKGILFIDEINRAPVLVQNALFQLILDRKLGEYVLPEGWVCIAAGNRESDGGGVQRMPSGLSNRFVHINVIPDLTDWCKWAVQNDVHPIVIAYQRFTDGKALYAFDRNADAFPTPRSWVFVSDVVKKEADPVVEKVLVGGSVGDAEAIKFLAYVDLYRQLPNMDAILLDPDNADVPQDMAVQFAVSSALAHRADVNNFGRVLRYIDRLPSEFRVYCIKDAITRDRSIQSTPEFTRWAATNPTLL
jgi:hypothetical protein